MTFIKLLFLFILITMMEQHGIIYRTGRNNRSGKDLEEAAKATSGPKVMHGTWRLSGVKMDQRMPNLPLDSPVFEQRKLNNKDLLISYFPDSSFTQIGTKGEYLTGRWGYDSETQSVFLITGRKTQEVALSFDKAANGLRLMSFEFGDRQVMSLIEDGKPISRYQEDPFYSANNQWRIKPAQPETKKELVQRLRNYLLHCAYVLKAADLREQRRVSLEFSDGIIRLYNVGIGIVKPEQIPPSWIDGYYSREDALKAYHIYEDYLLTRRHKKSQTGKWVRDDFNILMGIYEGLAKNH